ncbi:3H domain-containing protein [Acidaminococcus fermentans]|nr:3H domain-containing protein [Acidaminococcus fermentans]
MEGELNLRSRRDVQLYIQRMKETKAPLLSSISNGVHTHLVETETEEEMEAIHRALEKLGILVK